MNNVLMVNLSSPELDHLAGEFAQRGQLKALVRRYVNKGRLWENFLRHLPLIGRTYTSTLGRRAVPAGVDPRLIVEAGCAADFGYALATRLGGAGYKSIHAAARSLLATTERAVGAAGAAELENTDLLICGYHVARASFELATRLRVPKVLNYPIAHHRWQYRLYEEVAARFPAYAAALPAFGNVAKHAAALDTEIDLADRILVGSHFVRDTFVSEGIPESKIIVVPYGADAERFRPPDLSQGMPRARSGAPFRILFVGQLGERKGLSHLLSAYGKFRKPDTELHLVGNFVAGAQVYKAFEGLYRHTPHVPQRQLPELMRSADVFVLPTLVEGMPMVVLEAMACALPVIVTPHGPSEVVRDGVDGFVVPICDSEAIHARLEALYRDRDLRTRMGASARERARHWSWQRYRTAAADALAGQ